MRLSLISGPAAAVTLAEAKAHLRFDSTAEDTLLQLYLNNAIAEFDARTGLLNRAIGVQVWKLTLREFPALDHYPLPFPPLRSITHVKYYDLSNTQQTFSASQYVAITDDIQGSIELTPLAGWPSTYDRYDAVEIQFECGYVSAPEPIKAAILLRTAELFANRGDNAGPATPYISDTIKRLVSPYKVWTRGQW